MPKLLFKTENLSHLQNSINFENENNSGRAYGRYLSRASACGRRRQRHSLQRSFQIFQMLQVQILSYKTASVAV